MIDLKTAAQGALFGVLSTAPEVRAPLLAVGLEPDQDGVFQHVPEETDPPMVILGDMTATPAGGKGDRFDLIEFEVLTVVRRPGREFLTPVMAGVRGTIEGAALQAEGVELSRPVFVSDDDQILDDGQTYLGTQRFSLFAQPKN